MARKKDTFFPFINTFYLTKFDFKSVESFTCRFNFACDQHQARENVCAKQVTIVLFSGVFSQSSSLRPLQARKYCCGQIVFRNVSWAAVSPPTTKHFDVNNYTQALPQTFAHAQFRKCSPPDSWILINFVSSALKRGSIRCGKQIVSEKKKKQFLKNVSVRNVSCMRNRGKYSGKQCFRSNAFSSFAWI